MMLRNRRYDVYVVYCRVIYWSEHANQLAMSIMLSKLTSYSKPLLPVLVLKMNLKGGQFLHIALLKRL